MTDTMTWDMNYDIDTIRPSRYNGNHEHQCNNATVTTQRKRRITMNTEMTTQEMDMMDEIDEVVAQCTWFVEHGCMTIEKALEKVATSPDHRLDEIPMATVKRLLEEGNLVCGWREMK